MLTVNKLTRSYQGPSGTVTALRDVSFSVKRGEFVSIIGKSGSGKSTLLSLLGALDNPTSGSIDVDDVNIAKLSAGKQTHYRARKIGFVFQHSKRESNYIHQKPEQIKYLLEFLEPCILGIRASQTR
jgi:putative ABC transport system ATP-binding protein